MFRKNNLSSGMAGEDIGPRCSVCAQPAAVIRFSGGPEGVRLIYRGPGGSNGAHGDLISAERAAALRDAFTPPVTAEKLTAAELYDGAGFCGKCAKFYCAIHWNMSATGGGICPQGHFKSLDPHWSPDD